MNKKKIKCVHWANWAPRRSGLYECTKDQIKYERKYGFDSQIAITENKDPKNLIDDGWLVPISWEETKNADLFILHRGIPKELEGLKQPIIFVIHGTYDFLLLEEVFTKAESTQFNSHINLIKNCDASVAVNEHDRQVYSLYASEGKLNLINDAIDVERFTIEGNQYPVNHHPSILFADSIRPNKHPANAIFMMSKVVESIPDARLNIIGLSLDSILTWRNIILRSPNQNVASHIETIQLLTADSASFMRSADILINGNMSGIPSRTELEAMACGCQVVGYSDSFTKYKCSYDIYDMADKVIKCWNDIKDNPSIRQENRQWVIDNASMEQKVRDEYIPIYLRILKLNEK